MDFFNDRRLKEGMDSSDNLMGHHRAHQTTENHIGDQFQQSSALLQQYQERRTELETRRMTAKDYKRGNNIVCKKIISIVPTFKIESGEEKERIRKSID
jgi:hypothetical protein